MPHVILAADLLVHVGIIVWLVVLDVQCRRLRARVEFLEGQVTTLEALTR